MGGHWRPSLKGFTVSVWISTDQGQRRDNARAGEEAGCVGTRREGGVQVWFAQAGEGDIKKKHRVMAQEQGDLCFSLSSGPSSLCE